MKEEIIDLARRAGFLSHGDSLFTNHRYGDCRLELESFAKLVDAKATAKAVEREREACAVLLDENAKKCSNDSMAQMILFSNATAIRARGEA